MRKKFIKGFLIVILLILLVPFKYKLKDGGSIQYKAVLYKVTKYHMISLEEESGYISGFGIELFGIEIYNNIEK